MTAPNPSPQPPSLENLQGWFQTVITHPDGVHAGAASSEADRCCPQAEGRLDTLLTASRRLDPAARAHVYANAYYSRLIECLEEIFPMVRRWVGEDAFGGFAFGYLQQHPSQSYTLNTLGHRFADYLERSRPQPRPGQQPDWTDLVVDLARLEWAINEVFDGPGTESTPTLDLQALQKIDTSRWPELHLETAPCLRLIPSRFPINAFYSSLRQGAPDQPVAPPEPRPSFLALSRLDFVVRRHPLGPAQFRILQFLQQGRPVGEAIEAAARDLPEDDLDELSRSLSAWFQRWTEERFFTRILSPSPAQSSACRSNH